MAEQPQLQYRVKTTEMREISRWRDLSEQYLNREEVLEEGWDYRKSSIKIEYLELRVKPTFRFEPGYFQDTSDGEVVYFNEETPTLPGWIRVNVTPAEGDQ
jgi:hypothetical protein